MPGVKRMDDADPIDRQVPQRLLAHFGRPSKIQAFAKKPKSERPHIVETAIARGNLYGPGAADQVLERTHLG